MLEHSPTPWRVIKAHDDEPARIIDANDDEVAVELTDDDAAYIVDVVNMHLALCGEVTTLDALLAGSRHTCDKLRDLIRRMIPGVEEAFAVAREMGESVKGICALKGVDSSEVDAVLKQWTDLLNEAYEAVGKEAAHD
jgi:hypothetical protein